METRYEIKFYVGEEKDRDNNSIELPELCKMRDKARKLLAKMFDAFTEYGHQGAWGKPLVKELGTTYVLVIPESALRDVPKCAARIRDIYRQTCVLVTRSVVEAEFI